MSEDTLLHHTTDGSFTGLLCSLSTRQRALWGAEGEHWNWNASGIHPHSSQVKGCYSSWPDSLQLQTGLQYRPIQTRMTHVLGLLKHFQLRNQILSHPSPSLWRGSSQKDVSQENHLSSAQSLEKPKEIFSKVSKQSSVSQNVRYLLWDLPSRPKLAMHNWGDIKGQFSPKTTDCTFISV